MSVPEPGQSDWYKFVLYALENAVSDYFIHFLILVVAPYQSIKAIQRKDNSVAMKWLSFWIINHFIGMSEHHHFEGFMVYVPYYYIIKLALTLFLMFGGLSTVIYYAILDPLAKRVGLFLGDSNKNHYTSGKISEKTSEGKSD